MEQVLITDMLHPERSGTYEAKIKELFKGNCKVIIGKKIKPNKNEKNNNYPAIK